MKSLLIALLFVSLIAAQGKLPDLSRPLQGPWELGCTQYVEENFDGTANFGPEFFQYTYNFYANDNCTDLLYAVTAQSFYFVDSPSAEIPGPEEVFSLIL